MTYEHLANGKRWLLVKVPEGAHDFEIYNTYRKELRFLTSKENHPLSGKPPHDVIWLQLLSTLQPVEIYGIASDLSEEQAKDFEVTCPVCDGYGYTIEQVCCNNPTENGNCCGNGVAEQQQCPCGNGIVENTQSLCRSRGMDDKLTLIIEIL